MQKSSIKIIFFGTSDFAAPVLEALVKANYDVMAVITVPDKPVGRKQILTHPPIKLAAQKLGLNVLQPEKLKGNKEFLNTLNTKYLIHDTALGVVAAYGKLIPPEIFNLPKHGTLNIHPSLLPKYRGPSPIQIAILNGDTETGITIMKVDEEMDHGNLVSSCQLLVSSQDNYEILSKKMAELGAELLIKILPDYLAGKIKLQPQDHAQATFTKKFTADDGEIKPDDTPEQAYNKIRALNPEPGTYFWINKNNKKTRLKILEVEPLSYLEAQPLSGGLFVKNGQLILGLKNGYLMLKTVQPEGKKMMSGVNFARGYGKMLQLPHG